MTPAEFAARFHWPSIEQMAHEIDHAYANGCWYCEHSFQEMGHGLADISLDVINPDSDPFWATNVRLCCLTCNRAKQRMGPELWPRYLEGWKQWKAWQAKLAGGWLPFMGPLFEGLLPDRPYPLRQCKTCGGHFDEVFFPLGHSLSSNASLDNRRLRTCYGCRNSARDERKRKNRVLAKARDMLRRHAARWIDRKVAGGLVAPRTRARYGD